MAVIEKFHHHNGKTPGTFTDTTEYNGGVFGTGTCAYVDLGGGQIVARFTSPAGVDGAAYAIDTFAATMNFSMAGRFWLRQTPVLDVNQEIHNIRDSGGKKASLLINVGGGRTVQARGGGDALVATSGATVLAYDTPYIYREAWNAGTAGACKMKAKLTTGDDLTTIFDTEVLTLTNGTTGANASNWGRETTASEGCVDWDDIHWLTDTYAYIDPYTSPPVASHTEKRQVAMDFTASSGGVGPLTLTITQTSGPTVPVTIDGLIGRFDEITRTADVVFSFSLSDGVSTPATGTITVAPGEAPSVRVGPLYCVGGVYI